MRSKNRSIVVTWLMVMFLISALNGQNQARFWYFDINAGLDFSTSPPTVLTNGAIRASNGCSAISDPSGNLMFYTQGDTVFNSMHQVMANGTGLKADPGGGGHNSLVVKQPGNNTLYYIFTLDCPPPYTPTNGGVYYHVVDMSLAAGLGSVTVKNVRFSNYSGCKVTATRHCNGVDIWVLTHEMYNSAFSANLLTTSGFSTTPVTTNIGTSYVFPYWANGTMKFSPNGKKIGLVLLDGGAYELYDFDASTGVVSNSLSLLNMTGEQAISCEFSSDGSKFYANGISLHQWDVCAGNNAAVSASHYTMAIANIRGAMQLAPDGKIYLTPNSNYTNTVSWLAVIDQPNAAGAACNYTNNGQSIAPRKAGFQLPNFPTHYFYKPNPGSFSTTVLSPNGCTANVTFTPPATCPGSQYPASGYAWNFGDASSGSANNSNQVYPAHYYAAPGTYWVKLVIQRSCGTSNDTINQLVNIPFPTLTLSTASMQPVCPGQSVTVTATGAASFTWLPSGVSGAQLVLTPTAATSFTVLGSTSGCTANATGTLFVKQAPPLTFQTQSITCSQLGSATVQATSPGLSYTWMPTAQTGSAAGGLFPGTYTLYIFDPQQSCTFTSNTIFAPLIPLSGTIASTPMLPCFGDSSGVASVALAGGSGHQQYQWVHAAQPPKASATVSQLSSGHYTLIVTDSVTHCVFSQTFQVNEPPPISVTIAVSQTAVCAGISNTLNIFASGGTPGFQHNWGTAGNGTSIPFNEPAGQYTYVVVTTDQHQCSITNTFALEVAPIPTITPIHERTCDGVGKILMASAMPAQGTSYSWPTLGALTASAYASSSVTTVYTVFANYKGCTSSETATLEIEPLVPAVTEFTMPSLLCANASTLLPLLPSNHQVGGTFFSDDLLHIDVLTGAVDPALSAPGVHTITYSVDRNGCIASGMSTATLTIHASPSLTLPLIQFVSPGGSMTLDAGTHASYTWSPANGLSCTNCASPEAKPTATERYCVVVSDVSGCISMACTELRVTCDQGQDFSVPNAFSPNGDQNNDEFCLRGWDACLTEFQVLIFDRWGEMLFESNKPDFCWNGIYKGKLLEPDVFVYVIKANFTNGEIISRRGNITMLKP